MALIAVCSGLARFAYGLFVPAFRAEFALTDTLLGSIAAGAVAAVGMALVAVTPNPAILAGGVLFAGSSTGLASPPLAHALARR